jgi:GAF domain-containing protein
MDSDHQNLDYYKGTMFEKAYLTGDPLVISDCSDPMQCTENERRILTEHVQSILLAPLSYNGSVVGILSLKASVAALFQP